jgi:primosomal protein N' (replication factor Y)
VLPGCSVGEAESPQGRSVAQVLLDSSLPQLDHLFDYAVPDDLASEIRVGHRVRVPFRSQNRRSHGYVISFTEQSDFGGELQAISEIVGTVPPLTPEVWRLARNVADRAGGSASDILRLAIPQRMVRAEKQHLAAHAEASAAPEPEPEPEPKSEPELDDLKDADENQAEVVLADDSHATETVVEALETARRLLAGDRLAVTAAHGPARLITGEWVGGWAVRLARIALNVFAQKRSVILVAPDYRDTDQLHDALSALGHPDTVRVDARQSGSSRYAAFLRARDSQPRIILGNRSAIYAPAHRLGAILLWDDGDPLLAEPLSPYVHARDAALVRSALHETSDDRVGLLCAAHSRSLEVQRLIEIGYLLPEQHAPSQTRFITTEAVLGADEDTARMPDIAARMIREGLTKGPVLVQVATPGFAPVAVCTECRTRARCMNCTGPVGFRGAQRLACRWCGEQIAVWKCPECGSRKLAQLGAGSQRTAEQFERQFAGVRVVLSDGDHPHERVDSRPVIVVATRGAEPIAAGGYQAVVLLDAERLLAIETLRAAEDCVRWWMNAAALAAPGAPCVLTNVTGPLVTALGTGRIEEWLQTELNDRRQLRFPPAVRVASVTGGRTEVNRALSTLEELPGIDVLGPTPFDSPDAQATLVRAIVRFEYAHGAEVAKRLRGALVADAAGTSSRVAGRSRGRARTESLRLRFDDRGVFDTFS